MNWVTYKEHGRGRAGFNELGRSLLERMRGIVQHGDSMVLKEGVSRM